jgi:hypothetical protein
MTPDLAALILWLTACEEPFVSPQALAAALLRGSLATGAEAWGPASWGPPRGAGWQLSTLSTAGGPDGPFAAPAPAPPAPLWCRPW